MKELLLQFCVLVYLTPLSRLFCFLFKQTQRKQLNELSLNTDKQGVSFGLWWINYTEGLGFYFLLGGCVIPWPLTAQAPGFNWTKIDTAPPGSLRRRRLCRWRLHHPRQRAWPAGFASLLFRATPAGREPPRSGRPEHSQPARLKKSSRWRCPAPFSWLTQTHLDGFLTR